MKKGFTLIEILAVVTIIGLIFILVIPKIATSLKNKKGDVDTTTNNIVLAAAKSYVADNHDKFEKVDSNTYCLPISTLTKKEYLESPVKNVTDDVDITNTKSVKITYNKGFKYEIVDKKECIAKKYDYYDNEGNGYTLVEYLESTGTQYIDTELYGNEYPNLIVEIEGNYIKLEAYQYLFGVGSKSSSPNSYILLGQTNALGFIGQIGISGTEKKIMDADNQKHKFVLDAVTNVTTVDSTSIDMNTDNINAINYKYAIFAINNSGTVKNYAKFKMYYCKITNNNALIRDYIPVIDSSNRPCLFDKVEKICYYNQGTGEFLYG